MLGHKYYFVQTFYAIIFVTLQIIAMTLSLRTSVGLRIYLQLFYESMYYVYLVFQWSMAMVRCGSGSGRDRGIRGYTCYEFQQISLKTYAISFVKRHNDLGQEVV
jgi:hypothetical protein